MTEVDYTMGRRPVEASSAGPNSTDYIWLKGMPDSWFDDGKWHALNNQGRILCAAWLEDGRTYLDRGWTPQIGSELCIGCLYVVGAFGPNQITEELING
jgi:hypothetical protein